MKPLDRNLCVAMKEAGYQQNGMWYWVKYPEREWLYRSALLIENLVPLMTGEIENAIAPIAEEIVRQLPQYYEGGSLWVNHDIELNLWYAWYWQGDKDSSEIGEHGKTMTEALANLWLSLSKEVK